VVLHVALVAEALGADVALYDEGGLAPPVPRLVLYDVRGLHNHNVLNIFLPQGFNKKQQSMG